MPLLEKNILWCDRYIDEMEVFRDAVLEEIPYANIVKVRDSLDAEKVLDKQNNFSLIISSKLFPCFSGLDLYRKVDTEYSGKLPFILFTAAVNDDEIDLYDLRDNFSYFSKYKHTVYGLVCMIEDMLHRREDNLSEIHSKLKMLRASLGFSSEQFSRYTSFDLKTVNQSELSSENIPASYIHSLSKLFGIPMTLFSCGPLEAFQIKLNNIHRKKNEDSERVLIYS